MMNLLQKYYPKNVCYSIFSYINAKQNDKIYKGATRGLNGMNSMHPDKFNKLFGSKSSSPTPFNSPEIKSTPSPNETKPPLNSNHITTMNLFSKYYQKKKKDPSITWINNIKTLSLEFTKVLKEYRSTKNKIIKKYDNELSKTMDKKYVLRINNKKIQISNTLLDLLLYIKKHNPSEWEIK